MLTRSTLALPFTMVADTKRRKVSQPANHTDDATLLNTFLTGEDDAFLVLFRRHNQRLFTYCLKIVGDQGLAEDVTQEMWERVIGLREKPQEVRNPVGLFLRIARNLCLDHLKKNRRLVPLDDSDEYNHPAGKGEELSELEEMAVAALDRLPFEYREVLVLNLYCGYRFDEIAVMMGKSSEAIWAQASRGRAQLRKIVAQEIEARGGNSGQGTRPGRNRMEGKS